MHSVLTDGSESLFFVGDNRDASFTIGREGLSGWDEGTVTRRDRTPRPQRHGEYPRRGLLAGRLIVQTGMIHAASDEEYVDLAERLGGFLADGTEGTFAVTQAGGTKWATVSRHEKPDIRPILWGRVAAYQLMLWAPDPLRYADGDWVSTPPPTDGAGLVWPAVWPLTWPGGGTSGRIRLTNSGRAPSSPSFRLRGGFSSALITCVETGARLGFDRPTPAGSVVEISAATRRAVIDAQSDVSRWLRFREWADVPGRTSRTYQIDVTGPVGSPMLEGKVNPAWW